MKTPEPQMVSLVPGCFDLFTDTYMYVSFLRNWEKINSDIAPKV